MSYAAFGFGLCDERLYVASTYRAHHRPMGAFHVDSEVGALRRVLLHRPALELRRLTPTNCRELLFDDVLWVKRARQEHDAFADALVERGVEVLYLHRLLSETLELATARDEVLDATVAAAGLGPHLGPALREWLHGRGSDELSEWLIGGMTIYE